MTLLGPSGLPIRPGDELTLKRVRVIELREHGAYCEFLEAEVSGSAWFVPPGAIVEHTRPPRPVEAGKPAMRMTPDRCEGYRVHVEAIVREWAVITTNASMPFTVPLSDLTPIDEATPNAADLKGPGR